MHKLQNSFLPSAQKMAMPYNYEEQPMFEKKENSKRVICPICYKNQLKHGK